MTFTDRIEQGIKLLCRVLCIADIVLLLQKRNLILMYHSVDGVNPEYLYEIKLSSFEKQIQYLQKRFDIVPLDCLYEAGYRRRSRVALTFDDAYEDFYRNVFPLLKQHSIPATLFVPTAYVNFEPGDPHRNILLYGKDQVTWSQLAEMHESGLVEIGSHTHSHRDFREDPQGFEQDVNQSMRLIEEHTGQRPRFFAYPYGLRTPEMDAIIHQLGFQFAVMSTSQIVKKQFVEGRLDIYRRNEEMLYFKLTLAGLISTSTKDIYRKIRQRLSPNKAVLLK